MFKRFSRDLLAIMICIGLMPAIVSAEPAQYVPGRILVLPKPGATLRGDFQRALQRQGVRSLRVLPKAGVHIVQVPVSKEREMVDRMSRSREVAFAELDLLASPNLIVNDPNVSSQWHVGKMHLPEAWDLATGNGITVAVLDTGIYAEHPDLASKMVLPGYNAPNGGSDTSDIYGHGTSVAGVIAAVANNGVGVAGVAHGAMILPVRVTNRSDAQASCSDIAKGLIWAADHGARVANVSYGVMGCATLYTAGQYMMSKGGLVTVSAGNENRNYGIADTPYIITVAATTSADLKASFSCFGNMVDVTAPGLNIYTTLRNGSYGYVSGTSFSSPATAGVIALLFSLNPDFTPNQVESILERSVVDLGTKGWDPYYGYGRVDAMRALTEATSDVSRDVEAPVLAIISPQANSEVSGQITVEVSATDATQVQYVKLYMGATLIGTDTMAPYQFLLNTTVLPAGDIKLVAKAEDMNRNLGVSEEFVLTNKDVTAPSVRLKGLNNGATVTKYAVTLSVLANDVSGIKKLELKLDGVVLCSQSYENVSPVGFYCRWNPSTASKAGHTLRATATDRADNVGVTSIRVFRK